MCALILLRICATEAKKSWSGIRTGSISPCTASDTLELFEMDTAAFLATEKVRVPSVESGNGSSFAACAGKKSRPIAKPPSILAAAATWRDIWFCTLCSATDLLACESWEG